MKENDSHELARILRDWVAARAPDWTDANDADPGVALLALLAFAAESLEARGGALPDRGRMLAARLARAALALSGETGPVSACAPARNRYYAGRLLAVEDFQLEQDYFRRRLRRHNRALHGAGVVSGLQVSVHPGDGEPGQRIVVQPGIAIAADGEEIEVCREASASLPETGDRLSVILTYAERLAHPAPTPDEEQVQFTRIEETFALHLGATADESGIAVAHLIRGDGGWEIDQTRAVSRLKPCREQSR